MRFQIWLMILLGCFLCASNAYPQGTITTVAGTDWVFPSQTLAALNAPLGSVQGIAINPNGTVFFADASNQMIMEITASAQVQVVAGNGFEGFNGDGPSAISRPLSNPGSLAADQAGNIYVAETGRIRRLGVDDSIVTVAGGGFQAPQDGLPATSVYLYSRGLTVDGQGNLYFAAGLQVWKVTTAGTLRLIAGNGHSGFSGDGGPATQASMSGPSGVAVDSGGNIFISDYLDCRIRKVTAAGIIQTIAGNGQCFGGSVGDGGAAVSAGLNQPEDVIVDGSGNIYVLEYYSSIRKISANGIISTVLRSGLLFPEQFARRSDGTIFIADAADFQVKSLSPAGSLAIVAGNDGYRNSPNGTPAVTAWLENPEGVTVDSSGNLYISDLYLDYGGIRKIVGGVLTTLPGTSIFNGPQQISLDSAGDLYVAEEYNSCVIHRITSGGQITAVAGGGGCGFAGDGGPAANAQLELPTGVVVGNDGSVYISDSGNDRIRKISTSGIISTIAGNGQYGFGGDGGQATRASLAFPGGLALDGAGNLFIADTGNSRIRRLTPQGIITTVAGTGSAGFSGDGGLATSANLFHPTGLAVDATGNLYIADQLNNRVRLVNTAGVINTVAGNGKAGFAGDGGSATNALLSSPSQVALDKSGNLFIVDTGNNRIRKVIAAPVSFTANPGSLTFSATSGGAPTAAQSVTLSASLVGLPYSAQASVPWLTITPESGSVPASLLVSADPGQLSAGNLTASITITVPNANPSVRNLPVTFAVAPQAPPSLSVNTTPLTFAFTTGASQAFQQIRVSNLGGGTAAFTASAKGGPWLQVSPPTGSVSSSSPVSLSVTADPAGLAAGTYTGSVSVSGSTGDQFTVPVTMSISTPQQKLLLSQTGLTFAGVSQGGTVLAQSFGILNSGAGSMNWTAQASTQNGSGWLSVTPSSGTVTTPLLDVSFVNVTVNAQSLAPGNYYGTIQVNAAGADNSPQAVLVVLNVLPPGSNPGPQVQPSGLVFTGVVGSSNPGSQNVLVSNVAGSQGLTYGSSAAYVNGSGWLNYLPANATLSPANPLTIVVQPNFAVLSPGIYRGAVTLVLSDGSIRNVAVLSIAAAAGGQSSEAQLLPHVATCTPTSLQVQPTSLQQAFNASLNQPTAMEVTVVDNCGNLVSPQTGNAVVTASFNNGDPPVPFVYTQGGKWSGTWQPLNGMPGNPVQVTVSASQTQGTASATTTTPQSGQNQATATLGSGAPVPVSASVLNAASFQGPGVVAPGELIAIFGSGLGTGQALGGVPRPVNLGATKVSLGGQFLPLIYASSGQVNAQVPYGLPVNTQLQLQVNEGSALSLPQKLTVAAAQPAVFTISQTGQGQGAIVKATNYVVADANAPVHAGDPIAIFCTGLGEVSPAVAAGTAAPAATLSRTVNAVTLTIGGVPAQASFAGLAPGYSGLYQINTTVPAGVTPGNAVPVVIQAAGQTSTQVTMAVQ